MASRHDRARTFPRSLTPDQLRENVAFLIKLSRTGDAREAACAWNAVMEVAAVNAAAEGLRAWRVNSALGRRLSGKRTGPEPSSDPAHPEYGLINARWCRGPLRACHSGA